MARNVDIERAFLIADDAMQGLWGLQTYIRAAIVVAETNQLGQTLPPVRFKLTHEWKRHYDPQELILEMEKVGEYVISRMCLLNLVAVFEAAVKQFHQRLLDLHHAKKLSNSNYLNYLTFLKWAFETVRNDPVGSKAAIDRLPETCGDVDNARRLRNIIVHNNGRYEVSYSAQAKAFDGGWVKTMYETGFEDAIQHEKPLLLSRDRFEHFSHSHVELLHILHNTIQRKFFGHDDGYNYAEESKKVEWHRVLSG
jgi:hypothetical protein